MGEVSTEALSTVLFVFFGLTMMILSYELKKLIHIPVPTIVFLIGFLLRIVGPYIGLLSNMVTLVQGIDEEVVNLVFFPILIFDASFNVSWYTIKKEFLQILILATSVLVINTILTACALKYIFRYSFQWVELLLLGVVLSATDHFVINFLLKEIYASDQLETLIGGETMLNEASVLVLFTIVWNLNGSASGIANCIALFSRLAFGGLVLGIVTAVVMGFFVKRMLNDFVQETNTSIVIAYLLYYGCTSAKFSGALAVVSYGLYMSAYGKTIISPDVDEKLKSIIEIASRNVASLVFLIAGIIFCNSALYQTSSLTTFDFLCLIVLFPTTYIIRAITLLIHYPLLKFSGYGLTWNEFIVLVFAGIKGVMSTCLVLLAINKDVISEEFKPLYVYLGIGTSGLTIIFGSLFFKFAIKFLGFEEISDVQESMLLGVTSALIKEFEKKTEEIHSNKEMGLIDWETVSQYAEPTIIIKSIFKTSKRGLDILDKNLQKNAKELLHILSKEFIITKLALKIEMRRRYLSTLRGIYLQEFEEGMCHGDTSLVLIDSCNICLDSEKEEMNDWIHVKKLVYKEKYLKVQTFLSKWPVIGKFFRKSLYKNIILAYDAAHNFIRCHSETEELIDKMEIDIDKNIFNEIIKEADKQVKICEEFLRTYLIDCYPEILAEVQTKRSCKALLYFQRNMTDKIFEQGLIKELEYDTLKQAIESAIRTVTFQGLPSIPILRDILSNRFAGADRAEISVLISKIVEKKFNPDTEIFKENEPADGAYFIIRGRVNEYSSWVDQELIIGNIVGVQHLLPEFSNKNTSTAKALTFTILAHLPKDVIEIEGLLSDIYKETAEEMILLNREKFDLVEANEKHILRIAGASSIYQYRKGKKVVFPNGGLVFRGQAFEKQKGFLIKPSEKTKEIVEDCIVLSFPNDFKYSFDINKSLSSCFQAFCVRNSTSECQRENFLLEEMNETQKEDSTVLLTSTDEKVKRLTFKRNTIVPVPN